MVQAAALRCLVRSQAPVHTSWPAWMLRCSRPCAQTVQAVQENDSRILKKAGTFLLYLNHAHISPDGDANLSCLLCWLEQACLPLPCLLRLEDDGYTACMPFEEESFFTAAQFSCNYISGVLASKLDLGVFEPIHLASAHLVSPWQQALEPISSPHALAARLARRTTTKDQEIQQGCQSGHRFLTCQTR